MTTPTRTARTTPTTAPVDRPLDDEPAVEASEATVGTVDAEDDDDEALSVRVMTGGRVLAGEEVGDGVLLVDELVEDEDEEDDEVTRLVVVGAWDNGCPTVYEGAAENVDPDDRRVVLTVAGCAPGRDVGVTGC